MILIFIYHLQVSRHKDSYSAAVTRLNNRISTATTKNQS